MAGVDTENNYPPKKYAEMSVPRMNRLNRLTVNIGYNKQALVETTQVPKQAQSNTCLLACLGYNCAGTEATVLELELELELELDRICGMFIRSVHTNEFQMLVTETFV